SVLPRDLLGHQLDHVGLEGGELLARDGVLAELRAQVLEQDVLVDELHVDEDLAQSLARLALSLERLVELLVRQDLVVDEHLSQRAPCPAVGSRAHSIPFRAPSSSSRASTCERSNPPASFWERNAR